MNFDEMKKIAAARTPERWNPDSFADAQFIAMAANNWNKMVDVIDAAIQRCGSGHDDKCQWEYEDCCWCGFKELLIALKKLKI